MWQMIPASGPKEMMLASGILVQGPKPEGFSGVFTGLAGRICSEGKRMQVPFQKPWLQM
jgi:hypothetical protein